jgi:hypothetical protein
MSLTVILILGIAMLVLGRKLFWLFVGVAGFALGMYFSQLVFPDLTENGALVAGLLCGAVGVVLAFFLQRIALAVAGFLSGGLFVMNLMRSTMELSTAMSSVLFIVGGIAGAIFVSFVFDWALVILSSLVGAALVTQAIHLQDMPLLMIGIALVGILIQAQFMKKPTKNDVEA